jgi:hypothetical protein
MKRVLGTLGALLLGFPALASPTTKGRITNLRRLTGPAHSAVPLVIPASGIGVNLPVVGKLTGNGGVDYFTAIDIANNTGAGFAAEFFFDCTDVVSGAEIHISGNATNPGLIADFTLDAFSDAHFDDFASDLVGAGGLTQQEYNDGVLGSMLVVFDGTTAAGQGTAQARFYSNGCGGTIGVSAKGQVITGNNLQHLSGVFRDTLGEPSVPQLYPNMFLNNLGITPGGSPTSSPVTVTLTAYGVSAGPGTVVAQQTLSPINPGQTAVVNRVFDFLGVNLNAYDTIIVFVDVISGDAAIDGLAVEVDQDSLDGSSTYLSRAE